MSLQLLSFNRARTTASRRAITFLLSMCITACSDSALRDAETAVANATRDPGAVQFRAVRKGADGVVCGEFNAKNAFGGYVGFRRFMVTAGKSPAMDTEDLSLNQARWRLVCLADSVRTDAERDSLRITADLADSALSVLGR